MATQKEDKRHVAEVEIDIREMERLTFLEKRDSDGKCLDCDTDSGDRERLWDDWETEGQGGSKYLINRFGKIQEKREMWKD